MRRRRVPAAALLAAAVLLTGAAGAQPRYDYGGSGYEAGDGGFLVRFEGGVAAARNTDNIVAASGPNVIIPEWDEDFAGRVGLGYRFHGGSEIAVSLWGFETEQSATGAGFFDLPIGPTQGTAFDITTEIEARTIGASWTVEHEIREAFDMRWSLGVEHASFDETTGGSYTGTPGGTVVAAKNNEGTMIGARASGRATYRVRRFSASVGLGLAALDGEVEASASLTPQPPGTSPMLLSDDSRSGTILEFDVRGAWRASERISVWLGWEQQVWEAIAADLARNLPGAAIVSRGRDSVTFSWAKLGASVRF